MASNESSNLLFPRQAQQHEPLAESSLHARLRLVEEKASNLNQKVELLESNVVRSNKARNLKIREFESDLLEVKRNISSIQQKLGLVIRELQVSAGKDELNTVKQYLDLWDLSRFVSRSEIGRLIEDKLNELKTAKKG